MSDDNKRVTLKDLQQTVADKKKEAKEIEDQSIELAEENNVPLDDDPDAVPHGEKFLAAIGYFSFLCILPLVLRPESKLCQFHGKQAMLIMIFFIIFGWILSMLASLVFGSYFVAYNMIVLIHVGFAFWGGFHAFKGNIKKLPFFGNGVQYLDW